MPYALLIIGMMLIVTGIKNTHVMFGNELKDDLTGTNNFVMWFLALFIVGAAGYVKKLETPSRMFMGLILVSIILTNQRQGLFEKFKAAIRSGPEKMPSVPSAGATKSPIDLPPVDNSAGADLSDRQAQARAKADADAKKLRPNTLWDMFNAVNPFASRPAY